MTEATTLPLLIGFGSNLMDAPRIEAAAQRLGYRVEWIESISQLDPAGAKVAESGFSVRQLTEALKGPQAVLIEMVTRWRPSLMVFDLGATDIPWREWIPLLKSAPATRRYPLVCFGPHTDVDTLQAAKSAGADAVLARSRFFSGLPEIIQQYARRLDPATFQETCLAPLPPKAIQGLELFNHGEYFEAHEVLEAAWNEDTSIGRDLYRGILQVAVAYLHIERGNYNGALKMFLRMRQWLEPLPEKCRGVDIGRLRQDAAEAYEHLLALGPEGVSAFDRRLFKPVVYQVE